VRSVSTVTQSETAWIAESYWEGLPKRVKVPYATSMRLRRAYLSRAGHEKSCLKLGGPPSKAKYETATDSGEVP
jgi:hypothetical protein